MAVAAATATAAAAVATATIILSNYEYVTIGAYVGTYCYVTTITNTSCTSD